MSKKVLAAVSLVTVALLSGCGSSSNPATSATSAVSGKVADGYLANAVVFLDKNGNYQMDQGEPSTVTDQQGDFTLQVPQGDIGKYPIVAMAVNGQTTDLDFPGQKMANSYLMSLPASAVSATTKAFVSPMSTLIREKMEAHPGMTVPEAMTELRNQMNLPSGMNVMADYVALGSTGSSDTNKTFYNMMHSTSQNMATLMGGQASQVMGMAGKGTTVDVNRFRTMMGALNVQLPLMVAIMQGGMQQNQTLMTQMMVNMGTLISSVPPAAAGVPFRNMSSVFPPMMDIRFWNITGHPTGTRNSGAGFYNVTSHFIVPMIPGSGTMGGGMGGSMGPQMMWK